MTADGYKGRYGRRLPGSPDLVFPRKRIVVFVDGCFWHGCAECARTPADYKPYWLEKIARTIERDRRITAQLIADGWAVIRVPEHELKTKALLAETAQILEQCLANVSSEIGYAECKFMTAGVR